MAGPVKIKLFLCECGPIIKDLIDLDELASALSGTSGVVSIERYATLCSEEGRAWLASQVASGDCDRVVIAGCSPREHWTTFTGVLRDAGMNPYLLTMANIREQCGWVTPDKSAATAKAASIVRAACARCRTQKPLEESQIDANTDALVIGAGVAGLTAAKLLAQGERKVYLVERTPAIGGKTVLFGETFPNMECASCMLEPLMDEVLHDENIEVLTMSEVEELLGYFGNFTARIRKRARHVDESNCFGCKACNEACPVEVPDTDFDEGLSTRKAAHMAYAGALPNASVIDEVNCRHFIDGSCDACVAACPFGNIDLSTTDEILERNIGAVIVATGGQLRTLDGDGSAWEHPAVYTTYGFERVLNTDGPTGGEIRLPDGRVPTSVALLHCASQDGTFPSDSCSATCCLSMAKYAKVIREKLPSASLLTVLWDRSATCKGGREFAAEAVTDPHVTEVRLGPDGHVDLIADDPAAPVRLRFSQNDTTGEAAVDLAVLAAPLGGAEGIADLAGILGLDVDERGFLTEDNAKLRPFASRIEGILIAGSAQAPMPIENACAQGAAAAAGVLAALVPGRKLTREATTASVNEDLCGGCHLCVVSCPYKAIAFDEQNDTATVNELLCHGCGACAAACPSSAIAAKHFTDEQLYAEIRSLCAGASLKM